MKRRLAHIAVIAAFTVMLTTASNADFESSKLSSGVIVEGAALKGSKLSTGVVVQGSAAKVSKMSIGIVVEGVSFKASKLSVGLVVESTGSGGGVVMRSPLTHW